MSTARPAKAVATQCSSAAPHSPASGAAILRPRIAVVDYGAGNLVSIGQALDAVGADVFLAARGDALHDIDALVVPGVGAARPAMNRLRRRGLLDPILAWAAADRPFLGICLGLQLLFEGSDEDGAVTFGLLPGRTVRLVNAPRLPHIGWNQVVQRPDHPLFADIAPGTDFYFVHSYAGEPPAHARDIVLAETDYGSRFTSAVARGNVAGVQFHPERSGTDGLRLLANFVRSIGVSPRGTPRATDRQPSRANATPATASRAASVGATR